MPLRLTRFSVPPYRSLPLDAACDGASVGIGATVAVAADMVGTGVAAAPTGVAAAPTGVADAAASVGAADVDSLTGVIGGVGGADAGVSAAADFAGLAATVGATIGVSVVDLAVLSPLGETPSAPPPSEHPPISGTNSKTKTAAARRRTRR